jgi:hypothetical protein
MLRNVSRGSECESNPIGKPLLNEAKRPETQLSEDAAAEFCVSNGAEFRTVGLDS